MKKVYQFKIYLLGIEPLIWRCIQVPENYSFWDLHVAIQDAMGWQDCHMHMFSFLGANNEHVDIGVPDDTGMSSDEMLPGWETSIKAYFTEIGERALYVYDFGDDWQHSILFEGILLEDEGKYPRIVDGKRACPPEDCGGLPGYQELIRVMKTRPANEYESMIEWLGKHYYPGKFKKTDVVFDDPKKRFRMAFKHSF